MSLRKHLIDRGMNPDLYRVSINEEENIANFLLFNLSGQIVGYHNYRPDKDKTRNNDPFEGRYFTRVEKGNMPVFGLELLNPSDRRIFVVEGIFKASKLHRLGYNAIAVLGATPKPLKNWFYLMNMQWDLIAIGDNDDAGQKLVGLIGNGFISPIDLDEMTDYSVKELIEQRVV